MEYPPEWGSGGGLKKKPLHGMGDMGDLYDIFSSNILKNKRISIVKPNSL